MTMKMEELSIIDQLVQLRITASSQIPPHEFLYTWNGTPCFAKGELVAVTGKAKSGKTYLNSLLMAAASGHSFLGLKCLSEKPLRTVWIDTEQSADSTCEILRDRIGTMIGEPPSEELYHVFNLRSVNWQNRLLCVLSAIAICQPDLVIFDGIRDVVGDINNYEEAQNLISQLLHVASDYKTCIVCVLHQNKAVEDKTLRGALGTELQNKSFETYECSKNPDTRIFTVKQTATRKYDMPGRIDFCLSPDGLPIPCEVPQDPSSSAAPTVRAEKLSFNPEYLTPDGKIDKARLFGAVLKDNSLTWNDLRSRIMNAANIRSVHFAEKLIAEARDSGLFQTILNNGSRLYAIQRQQQLFDEDT